jgi:CubicO group peptidase (beta-lactamase class C family)
MKKALLILLTFGLTQTLFCQKTIPQKLDALMDAYCKVNKFNGSVLVSQKGKTLLAKGYGIKNAQSKTLNDESSIFQIYSITKTVTSAVILKLVELKKLSLSDKLSKFYPEFPKGDSITIENLLTHTSGIYDYTRGNNMPDLSEKSFITFIETKPLDFSPGTSWSYSNSGYWLLGFISKKVTGMSYENAVRKFIFNPLQMTHSGFDFKNLVNKDKTRGYEIFSDSLKKEAVIYDPPGPFAAGAVYSTIGDLYKYHKGLQSFKVVSKEMLEKAYTPFKNNYGYGWMINSFDGKEIVSHSGGAAGYRSNFVRMPEDNICIILLNNTENSNLESITKQLFNVIFSKPYRVPSEIKLGREVLTRYVGCYAVSPTFCMYISIEDGRLAAQGKGQGKTIVLAQKENYFFAEEADGFLEFQMDENNVCNELIIHQGGQNISAKRFYPTWGLIGSATPKGWDEKMADFEFTEDSLKKGLWVLTNIKLTTGEVKFRFNNDWYINYGDNKNDRILDWYGGNIKVEAGTYDIILDLTDEAKPRYSILRVKECYLAN